MNQEVIGKKIEEVIAVQNTHKMAWYYEDPKKLKHKVIEKIENINGIVEINLGDTKLVFKEGTYQPRLPGAKRKAQSI